MNRPIIQPHAPIFDLPPFLQTREYEIVEGKYDFAKNMLILNVEVKDTLTDGTVETRIERRGFEITSLKVRTGKANEAPDLDAEPVELIGARTNDAMQSMLPSIIENLNKNVNKDVFFSTAPTGGLTKKTIRFAQNFQQVAGTGTEQNPAKYTVTDDSTTSATNSRYFGREEDFEDGIPDTLQVTGLPSSDTVQNKAALRTLLNYSNFESMIQDLGTPDAPVVDHDVDMSEIVINRHPKIAEFARLINTTNHLQDASVREDTLEGLKREILDVVGVLDQQLQLIDQFIEQNGDILSHDAIVVLQSQKNSVESAKNKYYARYSKAEKALNLLKDLRMLESMYGREALTLSLGGRAPMSAYLAKDLNLVMNQYGISFLQSVELEEEMADRLGLGIDLTVDQIPVERLRDSVNGVIDQVAILTVQGKIRELEDVLVKAEELIHRAINIEDSANEERSRLNLLASSIEEKLARFRLLVEQIEGGEDYDLGELDGINGFIVGVEAELNLREQILERLERGASRVESRRSSFASRRSSSSGGSTDREEDEEDLRSNSSTASLLSDEGTVFGTPASSPHRSSPSPLGFGDMASDDGTALFDGARVPSQQPAVLQERSDIDGSRGEQLPRSRTTAEQTHVEATQAVQRLGPHVAQLLDLEDDGQT